MSDKWAGGRIAVAVYFPCTFYVLYHMRNNSRAGCSYICVCVCVRACAYVYVYTHTITLYGIIRLGKHLHSYRCQKGEENKKKHISAKCVQGCETIASD